MIESWNRRRQSTATPAATPQGSPRGAGRIAVVDGLRLVAALMVGLYHYVGYEGGVKAAWGEKPSIAFPGFYKLASYGWLGVELFFMISGFVICMSCWGRTPGEFFRSRITRLFPAYWPAVLITTVIVTLSPAVVKPRPISDVLLNLTMLSTPLGVRAVDGSYWTLWAEACFYLLFTIVVWRGLTRRNAMIFCYGWLAADVITISAGKQTLLTQIFQPAWAPFFIAGIGFYLIHRFGPDFKLWSIVAISWAIAQHNTMGRVASVARNNLHRDLTPAYGAALVTLFFLVMAAVALGWLTWIRWGWLTTAGVLTYPFYLLHESIGWTLIHAIHGTAPRYVILVLVFAIMLAAAWLLHRFIEKPLARWLKNQLTAASSAVRDAPGTDGPPAGENPPRSGDPAAEPQPVPAGAAGLEGPTQAFPVVPAPRT